MGRNLALVSTFCMALSRLVAQEQPPTVLFFDDFEKGSGAWRIDNGVWEVGTPTFQVRNASTGRNVAGTVLSGRSPGHADARLVSLPIALPTSLHPDERLQLRFWHWSYANNLEAGVVEISVEGRSDWQPVSKSVIGNSRVWTQYIADLTRFAGSRIQVGFHFTAASGLFPGLGWYVDDVAVEISRRTLAPIEDFEAGIGDWYAERGVWEVGPPTAGPPAAFSGRNVAGTILGGRSPAGVSSRLVSPPIALPTMGSGERLQLKFFHWSYANQLEEGVVQIIGSNKECGLQHTISFSLIGGSREWVQHVTDVTDFGGALIRLAFQFTSDASLFTGLGWYVDRVELAVVRSKMVSGLRLEPAVVKVGAPFAATFFGADLTDGTYFDLRFRRPRSTTDEVALNWQRGTSMSQLAAVASTGPWTVTGVRAHDERDDHSGDFLSVSATITVVP